MVDGGGWVGSAGEGANRDTLFSQLSYCICTALKQSREEIKKTVTQCNQDTNANVPGEEKKTNSAYETYLEKRINE